MYGQAEQAASDERRPVALDLIKTFDYNLERMHKAVSVIEDKLHSILNLRVPEKEGKASAVPMEDDLTKALNNRLNTFAVLDDRLENIVRHLEKIVG